MAAEGATTVPYYLRKGPSGSVTSMNDGGLSAEKPPADEAATSYTYPDWEWVNGVAIIGPDGRVDPVRRVLTFTSAPLDDDLDVTGPIVLKLFASSTAIDTQFIVKLTDQHPQDEAARKAGRRSRASRRCRRAGSRPRTARRTRSARSPSGRSTPTPIRSRSRPARSTNSTSRCCRSPMCSRKATASGFELANSDSPATDGVFSHPYHPTQMGTDTIHHDAAHASCIMLPVIGLARRSLHLQVRGADGGAEPLVLPLQACAVFGAAEDGRRESERAELLLHRGGVARPR